MKGRGGNIRIFWKNVKAKASLPGANLLKLDAEALQVSQCGIHYA